MLSRTEKIAYGLGDTASNIIFQTVMLFLAFFYTDIFGISAAAVGTMFLVVRLIDAVTDPLMGLLTDKTRSRHGQFRPYLVWMAVPFAVFSVFAFTTPDFDENGKLIYAYVTYTLLMLAYTAINIPYSALGGVLTEDPSERVSVQSYRFVLGMLGGLLVTTCTLPLVDWFGQGSQVVGYQLTIAALSVLGMMLFVVCFCGTKERIHPPKQQQLSLREALKTLWQNEQWRRLSIAAALVLTGIALKNTLAVYYVKYYLLRDDLVTAFVSTGMVGNIIGCALAQYVCRYMDKVNAYIGIQVLAAIVCVAAYWIAPEQLTAAFIMYFLWGLFLQMGTPMLWAKIADVADYGYWKTGVRATGLVYSSVVFFIKFGLALGGAISGWWLAFYDYTPNQIQNIEAQHGIQLAFTVLPALASLLVAAVMLRYTLKQKRVQQISEALEQYS
ncbi:GPH family glycoside/pentoside/hexuronide:cation symporter [Idiomarina fontislapidosi]|uniref:MFS transporter n=1 Tax=Idiomarina fontislapidosi TaxID=263723 RepID=A0A432Y9M8_9GAMM|nr:glycoside-pentoside-hexuronide (GPH):cation symporter [Idiomarina fontislapidosi]PYE34476.1 GPH family glycoside/pentoside/hexuronide:cation symporter [Idiomarina fontislapidosi]RUO57566.1 MFS transporter [Idiomarina fontislapidosi]|tara:strand:- start:818 stop:2143 length:1326 start_codon:yes stop_codon:yes gene_type:complete